MSTENFDAIVRVLSPARFVTYGLEHEQDRARAVQRYEWNVAISAALFETLAIVEVAIRNMVHESLAHWSEQRGTGPDWFANRHGLLAERSVRAIDGALDRLAQRHRSITPGYLISELPFGFWRFLLSNRYRTTLWPVALRHAFPHRVHAAPTDLFRSVAQLHGLRNRIAHHEPIHRRDLGADYQACLFVLGAIDPQVRDWVARRSRVPGLLESRSA